jgi:hypothetical protein
VRQSFTESASYDASAGRALGLQPLSFPVGGDGAFQPVGEPGGGNANTVLVDGSGLAPYTASGKDFVPGGFDLAEFGLGHNEHVGAAQSPTEGMPGAGDSTEGYGSRASRHVVVGGGFFGNALVEATVVEGVDLVGELAVGV